ncbi:MAG: sigma-70 family RNA polymerase sigma factor [Clostridia bacterium]|nr:sigma-70 family RNA polymerase sigma factor [Clostridia bacterium]
MISDRALTAQMQEQLSGLYRLSLSILRSQADAQDAVQQGMLRAWEKRRQVSEEGKIRAWLTRIVVNECRNIQRKRMRVFPVADMPKGAQAEYMSEESELREAIDALPEKLRTPLLLSCMEGFSEREIAQALGVPATTVKSRLHRARKALRAALADEEVRFS